jgi:pyruvate/2-oxoglutarate dehydrogenase complex dihydrolipoamide acyltransferase (E2) component
VAYGDEEEIRITNEAANDVGIAVDTEGGLIVPLLLVPNTT